MLLTANKARTLLTGSVTSAAGQVAAVTASSGALFVGVGGVATSATFPAYIRCVLTAVDGNGNDTGSYEIVDVTRSADNLTLVTRGLEGTTAAAWGSGTVIECRPTAGSLLSMGSVGHISGVGATGLVATAFATLMPGATSITIPAGLLATGDELELEAVFRKIGTTTAWNADARFNIAGSVQSVGWYGLNPPAGTVVLWGYARVCVVTSTTQTFGGSFGSGGFVTNATGLLTLNLAVANTLDFGAYYTSAPAGGETIQLDGYRVALKRAG